MIYCDTSLLISALTVEVNSHVAKPWLLAQDSRMLAVSDWSITEFASGLAKKHRGGRIDTTYRTTVESAWTKLLSEFTLVAITTDHFIRAASLVDSLPRGLRAGDALHLAITLDHGCDLATLDRDLADAARALGVVVHPFAP